MSSGAFNSATDGADTYDIIDDYYLMYLDFLYDATSSI
jgi:hypothetical protein